MEAIRTNSSNPDFRQLVELLDAGLRVIDGDEASFFAQYNKIDGINNVVVVYENGNAAGCGAFKEYAPETAEIKRMFTRLEYRRNNIAAEVLAELENWARECGYRKAILETGDKMTAAIALYQKAGYLQIPNYGQYIGVKSSVCMEKDLKQSDR